MINMRIIAMGFACKLRLNKKIIENIIKMVPHPPKNHAMPNEFFIFFNLMTRVFRLMVN